MALAPQDRQFLHFADQGDHDLGHDLVPLILDQLAGRFHDRLHLHVVDFGIGDPQAAAAMAEHGVELVQELDLVLQGRGRDLHHLGQFLDLLVGVGEELVQRRVEEADGDRQALHLLEDAEEVPLLHRQDLGQGALAPFQVLGQDHLAHGHDPVALEEHVLGAAQADALGPELAGDRGVVGGVGIGADLEPAVLVDPFHEQAEVSGELGLDRGNGALHDLAGGAVEGNDVALLDHFAVLVGKLLGLVVDLDVAAARDAALAHAAGDDGCVGGHAAAGGEDALGGVHAVDVLGAGLDPHQDDLKAQLGRLFGLVGGEDDLAAGGAGGGGKTLGDDILLRLGVEGGMQELVELLRGRPAAHLPCRR